MQTSSSTMMSRIATRTPQLSELWIEPWMVQMVRMERTKRKRVRTTESARQRRQSSRGVRKPSCTQTRFSRPRLRTRTRPSHYSTTPTNTQGLALCSHITLDVTTPSWVPARTPTVHGGLCGGRPWVARTTTTRATRPQTTALQEQALSQSCFQKQVQSYCHLEIIHGSGAGSWKTADSRRRCGILTGVRQ